jgi:pseudaminic acid synthase
MDGISLYQSLKKDMINGKTIKIGNKIIGDNYPTWIIAEISANHGQKFDQAVTLIKKAKECGVDAVKFQAYTPDTLTIDVKNKYFTIQHPKWGGQTLYNLYKKAYTPWDWLPKLKKVAESYDLIFFTSEFNKNSIDLTERIGVKLHKISSFELNDPQLLTYVAKTNKPIIISTGMATLEEIKLAVGTIEKNGNSKIIILKCVSDYPANPEEMNLQTLVDLKKQFTYPIGLSDHTLEIETSLVGVTLGARVIEKHFTLSRKIDTPDSFFSLEPSEFKLLVDKIRLTEKLLGKVQYGPTRQEKKSLIFRRSIFVVEDIKKDEYFTQYNIRSIRPGYGLSPQDYQKVTGKKASRNLLKGTPLRWGDVTIN